MPFSNLGLCDPILQAIEGLGYSTPTPIQKQAIPVILSGKDLIATAQTGTGKTIAFLVATFHYLLNNPQAQKKQPRAIIMAPTRELAVQIFNDAELLSKHTGLSLVAIQESFSPHVHLPDRVSQVSALVEQSPVDKH